MQKKLIILGIRGIPAAHGGFETFVEKLAPFLRDRGWEVTVYCQEAGGAPFEDEWEGIKRVHIPAARDGSWGTIEFDIKCISDIQSRPGLVLTLGYNTGFLSGWLRVQGRKNIINMDGLEWKRDKYSIGPKAYLWCNERIAAYSGDGLIADHPAIADHLRKRTRKDKITVIPYGSDQTLEGNRATLREYGLEIGDFYTLIARPEPENSILEIVEAFSLRPRNAKLVVLGSYSETHAYQRAVRRAAGPETIFTGAIYEKEKLKALRYHSTAYFHGHQVGGTNPSLVEALGAGNAVIAHDNRFNRWVAGKDQLYFKNKADIDNILVELNSGHDRLIEMRTAAKDRWRENFTWPSILSQYEALLKRYL